LWRWAVAHCPEKCAFLLMLLTDTLQWMCRKHKYECKDCAAPLCVSHLLTCPKRTQVRRRLVAALWSGAGRICDLGAVADDADVQRWGLGDLMVTLGISRAGETCAWVGAWEDAQFSSALGKRKVDRSQASRIGDEWRRLMLTEWEREWQVMRIQGKCDCVSQRRVDERTRVAAGGRAPRKR
jgi:hypothetical protein